MRSLRIVRLATVVALLASAAACSSEDGDPATGGDGSTTKAANDRVRGYIASDSFSKLVLEVDYVAGTLPRSGVERDLVEGLKKILDKPQGITARHDATIASRGSDHAWTFDELKKLADRTFDLSVDSSTTKIHTMLVDGHYSEDQGSSKVLGVAWSNRHLALFSKTIGSACGGVGPLLSDRVCAAAELTVWTHEVGHVLGLVDNGLPMVEDHRDADHGAHDRSKSCVMYWQSERSSVITLLEDRIAGNEGALGFDSACRADIAAVKDK